MIRGVEMTDSGKIVTDERIIGAYTQNKPGLNAVFLGGVHGNEPSGILAIEEVVKTLRDSSIEFNGCFTGLKGNIPALIEGKRYIDRDLNRIWNTGYTQIKTLKNTSAEWKERKQLLHEFDKLLDSDQPPVFIDLHTTSAEGAPFMAIGDTLRNRRLAEGIPTPVILGFEEHMKGTLFNFFNYLGVCSILFEGGQHESNVSVKNHVAFIWLVLVNLGCIDKNDVPGYEKHFQWLQKTTKGKSSVYETIYRYAVKHRDLFKMDMGYENFQPVEKQEQVATYDQKRVELPYSGKIFMPLYQKQGEDGFFIIQVVRPLWLNISKKLRRLKIENIFHHLPGIHKHHTMENTFIINPGIAFLFPRQFFHLFGYKKLFIGSSLVMARRKYDLDPPSLNEIRMDFKRLKKIN